jgi:hypothetical protein
MKFVFFSFLIALTLSTYSQPAIYTAPNPTELEVYASLELQRYIFQVSGERLTIKPVHNGKLAGFMIGTIEDKAIKNRAEGSTTKLSDEGYSLHTDGNLLMIVSKTPIGCLYGVYGLLEDYYGIGFYLGHDVIPTRKKFSVPMVNEMKNPSVKIRGFLPWTNFPQSATVYSWNDWKFIIDQAAKMRMNFIHVHNYNGEAGHNEMFHNFTVNGITSRVWMPTAKTGHGWSCKGFDVKNFRFGAEDLFDDYDFGADCALHNEKLSNDLVFRKGVSLFKRVIEYAHSRGVKIGLGLDIDLIPSDYRMQADDPAVVKARMDQVLQDYPYLDYLILFISENVLTQPEKVRLWRRTFDAMHKYLKAQSHSIKIAVAGWGLSKELADGLPADVIMAPISRYADTFEDGSIYGSREYWGCPWMERDFFSSQYYYPYDMHLSNTIKAWQNRGKNMKGLYTLTWRLTDAIDPKLSFIAKAPWDSKNKYLSSKDVYHEYALKNYGVAAADALTAIINENEPLSCNDAECQPTGSFTGKKLGSDQYLLNLQRIELVGKNSRRILHAVRYDSIVKAGIEKRADADSCVARIEDGAILKFSSVDLTNVHALTFFSATANSYASIEIRVDKLSNEPLRTFTAPTTGGWHNWQPYSVPIHEMQGTHDLYLIFRSVIDEQHEEEKTKKHVAVIESAMEQSPNKDHVRRMSYVAARLRAADLHVKLNYSFPQVEKASDLTLLFPHWVRNFTARVTDISSLGNIQSVQNRYVQERYLVKETELLQKAKIKFPTQVTAKGTMEGLIISWQNNELNCKGFNVYASNRRLNTQLIPANHNQYAHESDVEETYYVTAINQDGTESERSPGAFCSAGKSDREPPLVVLISPPSSAKQGSFFTVKIRLLDERSHDLQSATLHYRKMGNTSWTSLPMQRRIKAVFTGSFLCSETSGYEYFISANDGNNEATFPADTASRLSVIVESHACPVPNNALNVSTDGNKILWDAKITSTDVINVYRATAKDLVCDASIWVTYLPPEAISFEDNGRDFMDKPLQGVYYYRIQLMDSHGCEKGTSQPIRINYPVH